MFSGIKLELCVVLPPGFFALKRGGRVVDHGRMAELGEKMQTNDVLLIGEADWDALEKIALSRSRSSAPLAAQIGDRDE